jgi:transcriptional regulator with XRE-family HTH domain
LLFFSKENPLWTAFFGRSVTQKAIAERTRISQSTLSNWRKGGGASMTHIAGELLRLKTDIQEKRNLNADIKRRFFNAIDGLLSECQASTPTLSVYDFAKEILSMRMEECQKILDEIIYERSTLFPTITYTNETTATSYFAKYGGSYALWIRRRQFRDSGPGYLWIQSPLRVRYVLRLGNSFLIRCKLNAPIFASESGQAAHWEYDGFLRTRDSKVFWMFEKRENLGSDFFYCITNEGRILQDGADRRFTLAGTYLTTGQDEVRSIEHSDVLLQRRSLPNSEPDEDIAKWMHEGFDILDPSDPEKHDAFRHVEELWETFTSR